MSDQTDLLTDPKSDEKKKEAGTLSTTDGVISQAQAAENPVIDPPIITNANTSNETTPGLILPNEVPKAEQEPENYVPAEVPSGKVACSPTAITEPTQNKTPTIDHTKEVLTPNNIDRDNKGSETAKTPEVFDKSPQQSSQDKGKEIMKITESQPPTLENANAQKKFENPPEVVGSQNSSSDPNKPSNQDQVTFTTLYLIEFLIHHLNM
jgi:hypothetical protein